MAMKVYIAVLCGCLPTFRINLFSVLKFHKSYRNRMGCYGLDESGSG
jgi:hypothetical protein